METELLVQADRLVGGSDAVLVIDDTAIAKNDFLPPSPPAQKASARKDQAGQSCTSDGARNCGRYSNSGSNPINRSI
jgi:hypothetical protein